MGASGKEEGGGRGRRDAAAGGYPPEQEGGEGVQRLWCQAREEGEVWRLGLGRVWALAQQPREEDWKRSTRGDWAKASSTRERSTQPINA